MSKTSWMVVIGTLALASPAAPADDRGGLKGLTRLSVLVEPPPKESAIGLDAEAIRRDVELQLGLAGIEVAEPADGAVLRLAAKALFLQTDGVHRFSVVMVDADVLQDVIRRLDGYAIPRASTWSTEQMIFIPAGTNADQGVRNAVKSLVGVLLEDHLRANPPQ